MESHLAASAYIFGGNAVHDHLIYFLIIIKIMIAHV